MDCVSNPCGGCSSGERSSDVNIWTTDISKVLNSPRARRKFHSYIALMNLDEAEQTLHLWEQIDIIQKDKMRDDLPRNTLLKTYKRLYRHADDYINFDEAEMRQLRRLTTAAISSDEEDEILEMAKQSAQKLLMDDHRHFSSHLWSQMGR